MCLIMVYCVYVDFDNISDMFRIFFYIYINIINGVFYINENVIIYIY